MTVDAIISLDLSRRGAAHRSSPDAPSVSRSKTAPTPDISPRRQQHDDIASAYATVDLTSAFGSSMDGRGVMWATSPLCHYVT